MEGASGLEDPNIANLTYDPKIPIQDILSALGQMGEVTSFRLGGITEGIPQLSVALRTVSQAKRVAMVNHIRRPEFSLTMDAGTQTPQETEPGASCMPAQESRKIESTGNPNSHPPSRIPRYEDEAYTRLFCKLPWYHEQEEREEELIRHFSRFGELMYHKVMNDRCGQLRLAYVCYYLPENAADALRRCDPAYRARPAEPRKMSILDRNKADQDRLVRHAACGNYVEQSIIHLHENTCRRLKEFRRKSPFERTKIRKRSAERNYDPNSADTRRSKFGN